MSDERRYTEAEVEEILRRATDRSSGLPRGESEERGLTLRELQDIGGEVGIPTGALADAARSLDRSLDRPRTVQRALGLPLSVAHTVELPRNLSELEWERLVGDLRETFRARGKVRQHGRLREWSNGNLHALVEPSDRGWRLRMGTTKGSARQLLGMGSVMLVIIAVLAVLSLVGLGVPPERLGRIAGLLGGMGLAGLGVAAVQLPPWARKRREQMEGVAVRLEASLAPAPAEDGGSEPGDGPTG